MGDFPKVRITNDSLAARHTKIELDGQDISQWVYRYELVGALKDANVLRLDLYVGEVEVEQAAAGVAADLDRSLCAALERQGWTPPDSELEVVDQGVGSGG